MAFEEKRAWIMAIVSICGYAVYLVLVLGRAGDVPTADVPYVTPLLWTVGGAIVAGIAGNIAVAVASPSEADKADQRDKEISRFGEHVGQSFLVLGAVVALILAMAEQDYFWIANAIYLAFVLSAVLGSVTRIFAYRRGFQPW
jgi:hypothetical protein